MNALTRRRLLVFGIPAAVVVAALLAWGLVALMRHWARADLGQPVGAWFVPPASGDGAPTLVLADGIHHHSGNGGNNMRPSTTAGSSYDGLRLSSVDIVTGVARRAQLDDVSAAMCAVQGPGALYCDFRDGVIVDPVTLAMAPPPHHHPPLADPSCWLSSWADVGGVRLHIAGDEVMGGLDPAGYKDVNIPGQPQFLGDPTPRHPSIVVGNAALVVHQPNKTWTLSLVGADSKLVWSVPIAGECQALTVSDGAIVLATDSPATRALAIELKSGKVLWRLPK